PLAAVGKVEPSIEARVAALPARRDQRPVALGNAQALEHFAVVDRARNELAAHPVELCGRPLDVALDLVERERIVGALVPIALAVDRVKQEALGFRLGAPIGALLTGNALHQGPLARQSARSSQAMRCISGPWRANRRAPRRQCVASG